MRSNTIQRMVVNEMRRMYDSGSPDRLTFSWDSNSYTADQVSYAQLELLRARSRHQARNNDYVIRLIQILKDNIVGAQGFKLRSKVIDFNGKPDRPARQAIERAWMRFVEDSNLVEIEQLLIDGLATDGEALCYLRVERNGNIVPTLIDPVRLDINFNEELDNGNVVRMGIEYDSHVNPVAYHINDDYQSHHPSVGASQESQKRTRIPALQMLHLFRKNFIGQKRGTPWIAPSLGRLFQLGEAEKAALTAFRIGAAKMGFFRSDEDEEYTGDGESGDMMLNAEAGTFENIGSLKFEAFDPTYPSGDYAPFVERILKGVSSGLGVDYHSLGNDLSGVNYSSARVGMLETREYFKTIQGWIIHSFLKPLFKLWLDTSLLYQRITIGQRPLSRGLDYYLPAQFVGRRWDWVDPKNEAMAKKTQYDMRTVSLSQIIRERGDEPEDVFREIAEENELMEQLGISAQQVLSKLEAEDEPKEDTE
ncbi:phage portal protein [Vibrio olivae]|uniref:Phage portal protein n=1 Tax=Vibrio olivae TaxID=1243002 RepID=A0ABV5HRJ5_9VIBR